MDRIDAGAHLRSLIGTTILTLTGRPNHVIDIQGDQVIVGTDRSPAGTPVPIESVQEAMDMLHRDGEIQINVKTVGYRSALIGAVLLTVPGAEGMTNPRRVRV